MNVVDSSGWLEYFGDAPNADFFAPAIEATEELVVPVITLYEVYKRVLQERGEDEAVQAIAQMMQGTVVDLSPDIAIQAAHSAVSTKLAMADSLIYTTAQIHNALLWTQDEHFDGLDGVRYVRKR